MQVDKFFLAMGNQPIYLASENEFSTNTSPLAVRLYSVFRWILPQK